MDGDSIAPACDRTQFFCDVEALTVGGAHACALSAGGKVACWGKGTDGQCGPGVGVYVRPRPIDLAPMTQIAAGTNHTCSISKSGDVWCWGSDGYGQLGRGGGGFLPYPPAPVITDEDSGVTFGGASRIAAGHYNTCALAGGKVFCWGNGDFGSGGAGSEGQKLVPTLSSLAAVPTEIDLGVGFACALTPTTTAGLTCWGVNNEYQLANTGCGVCGFATRCCTSPVEAKLGFGRKAIGFGVGATHACAISAGGKLECWGCNQAGAVGATPAPCDGTAAFATVLVSALAGPVKQVAAGYDFTCALEEDSTVECFGANDSGQLGRGGLDGGASSHIPQRVVGLPRVSAILAGGSTACALGEDRRVYCWGNNEFGQLGNGDAAKSNRSTPSVVILPEML